MVTSMSPNPRLSLVALYCLRYARQLLHTSFRLNKRRHLYCNMLLLPIRLPSLIPLVRLDLVDRLDHLDLECLEVLLDRLDRLGHLDQ